MHILWQSSFEADWWLWVSALLMFCGYLLVSPSDRGADGEKGSDSEGAEDQIKSDDCIVLHAVRHAEKSTGLNPGLTDDGKGRAEALVEALSQKKLDVIFTSEYRRCRETIGPLSQKRGIDPQVIEAADLRQQLMTLKALTPGSQVVLCGHANTVPMLIQALGGVCSGLEFGMLPESAYDRIYTVTFPPGGLSSIEGVEVKVWHYGRKC